MNIEGMSGAILEEMYGYDEYMGFSLKKLARKTVNVAKKTGTVVTKVAKQTGGVVARNAGNVAVIATAVPTGGLSLLAKKNVRKVAAKAGGVVARNAGNVAVIATAVPTGGLSLLAKKSGRNVVGSAARMVQKKIVRPVSHGVATVARNPAAANLISKAAASFIPGGSAALEAASMFKKKARSAISPFTASATPPPAAVEITTSTPVSKAGFSMPLVIGIGSVGLAALFMAMKKK